MDILNEVRSSPMSRLQMRAVAVAIALMLIDGMDVAVAAYAAPSLSKAWSLDPVTLGFLLSSGLVGMAAGSLFLTPFSDKIGRRRMMLVALVLVSAGMVLSVFAGDVVQLMAYRVLAGLGIGGMIANLNVFVSEYSSDKRRGSIFGLYTAGFAIGATLGGFIAGPLIPQFGWRSVFVVGAGASVLILALTWRFLPESLDYLLSRRPRNALAKVNAILVQMQRPALAELPELPQDQQAQRGIKDLLSGRIAARTVLLWVGYGLMIAAYYFASTWTPKLIATSSGDDSLGITMGLVVNFGGIIGCFIFSVLAVFLRSRHLLLGSLLVSALVYVVFGMAFNQTSIAIIIGAVLGVVTSANVAGFYATAPALFPAALRGTGIGWMVGIGRLVSIISPVVVGYLLAGGWQAENIFVLFGLPLIVSALAMTAVWSLSAKTTSTEPKLSKVS
ncbi:MFS transporter [Arthrobacter sp. Leaf337]|uniref:MFS transporter n=1 Tax=Arthrobacter sp. Leaf337 TaxID=1736342 RepID=UPI0006FE92E4|nr:MFS transporter [Arthrobacter sp. Leaf337]KQR63608.1 MFS transporter [Arthrobacter sp. Leaf337]